MLKFLHRWFSIKEETKLPRSLVLLVNILFLAPLIWYARISSMGLHYTVPELISSIVLGYILLGFQIYGFVIVLKLIMLFRKKIFLSEENLELYRRLGIIMFLYVFAYYLVGWVNLFMNKRHLPDDYAVVFFTNDNILYLCAGLAIYLAARYKQKQVVRHPNPS